MRQQKKIPNDHCEKDMSAELPFHLKYRPRNLDKLLGHDQVVDQLRGQIKTGKIPNALLFVGPSSAGKTTLARAFAAAVNDVSDVKELQGSYQEINAADQRTSDDVREIIRTSRFRPTHKRRIIVVDEAQQLLSNAVAAQILLKPLEEPASTTTWILCSMDPQKFQSGTGRAIANRCQQFVLDAPDPEILEKYGRRIIKREDMAYAKPILSELVSRCNSEFRTLAQMLQAVQQWVETNGSKRLKKELPSVLGVLDTSDDDVAIKVMVGIYAMQYKLVARSLLDVKDSFRFTNSLLWAAQHMLNIAVLGSERHPQVKHWARVNKEVQAQTRNLKLTLGQLAMVNEAMVNLRIEAQTFQVEAQSLMAARLYRLIMAMKE